LLIKSCRNAPSAYRSDYEFKVINDRNAARTYLEVISWKEAESLRKKYFDLIEGKAEDSEEEIQHDYVLTHREDKEAFHAYVDKLNAEGNWVEMPPLQSMEDLENNPELIKHFHNNSEPK
jgi:hypothetical protein